jgi:hypothetical protein
MRNYNDEIFVYQYPAAVNFVTHLTCYKELWNYWDEGKLKTTFWRYTIDAHGYRANILWCLVFGSASWSNQTHLKKLFKTDEEVEIFYNKLLDKLDFSQQQWESYYKQQINFRNKYAAHVEIGASIRFPNFDKALETAIFYDEYVRDLIGTDTLECEMLPDVIKTVKDDLKKTIEFYLNNQK